MQADFYQLAASPIERVLPRIAERVLEGGGRLLVVAADEALGALLDKALWAYAPESFLPHGRSGGEADADQPILIAPDIAPANGARAVALADGVWRDEALAFERAFLFFDATSLAAAREAWKGLANKTGVERNFWRQEGARWVKAG